MALDAQQDVIAVTEFLQRNFAEAEMLQSRTEGAIFAELIPFTETRSYVKHVLSNTVDYAALASGQPQSLKRWLGQVAPASNEAVAMP